jgi:hypothetical protein
MYLYTESRKKKIEGREVFNPANTTKKKLYFLNVYTERRKSKIEGRVGIGPN